MPCGRLTRNILHSQVKPVGQHVQQLGLEEGEGLVKDKSATEQGSEITTTNNNNNNNNNNKVKHTISSGAIRLRRIITGTYLLTYLPFP
jgi:hypothetical protein